jgi:hypothetical protein
MNEFTGNRLFLMRVRSVRKKHDGESISRFDTKNTTAFSSLSIKRHPAKNVNGRMYTCVLCSLLTLDSGTTELAEVSLVLWQFGSCWRTSLGVGRSS